MMESQEAIIMHLPQAQMDNNYVKLDAGAS
jgi:hypothetical protein